MSDTKISEMTAASALTGTEVVPVLQSSTNKRTTAQAIANLAITGALTANKIPKAASATTASDSTITDNGGVTIGSPTGGAKGAGTLNIDSGLYLDGVAASGADVVVAAAGAATLNTPAGKVTSEALIAATSYTLTLTNSCISATSIVTVNATNSANLPVTVNTITEGSGSVVILVGMAGLTGTVIIRYHVSN